MEKVKIGFVGVGAMGQCAHLRSYVTVPDCEVVALAEVREDLGQKVATRYGVPKVYKDHDELLANERLDGIVCSQPFTRYGTLIPELAKAGIPVFTEKPLAGSIEMGEKIVRALEANNTWQMVGYHKRSDPAIMYARAEIDRLLSTGELGKMRYVRITMAGGDWVANGLLERLRSTVPGPPLASDPPPGDMTEDQNRQFFDFTNFYIHQLNLLRHLLCSPYKVTFADRTGVLLAAESESGVCGTIEMGTYTNSIEWRESAMVCFERGYLKVDLPAPLAINRCGRVEYMRDLGTGTPETIIPMMPWVHAMRQQAMNFVSAVRGEMKPLCEAHEALEDLLIARDYLALFNAR